MALFRVSTALAWVFLVVACESGVVGSADLVLTNARVYTVNDGTPWADAVAIRGSEFVYVGDTDGAMDYVGASTVNIDMRGRFIMPGIIDAHTHPGLMGVAQYGETLPRSSREDFLAGLEERIASEPGDGWLYLCCWPHWFAFDGGEDLHKHDLDAIAPDRPVWVTSNAHTSYVNSKGLELLGVDRDTPDPRTGIAMYGRDEDGELTGIMKEGAGWQHLAKLFAADPESHQDGMDLFLRMLRSHGVTTVYDAGNFGYEDEVYAYLSGLEKNGELAIRYEGTTAIYVPDARHEAIAELKRLRSAYGGERLRFNTIKLFMDGVNSNRSGALLEPYADDSGHYGNTMLTVADLSDFLVELHEEKIDLHVHAIGDLAVRSVLDAVESARSAVAGEFYPRVSIAHLQLVEPEDYGRFAELGVSANFTPWWHGADDSWTDPALGEERYGRSFALTPLLDAGANVTFSSDDWRPDVLTPFLGIEVGYTRRDPVEKASESGAPGTDSPAASRPLPVKFDQPELGQMIEGYTINAAYPLRKEDRLGSIEVGKLADLVVLEESLFDLDPRAIHDVKPAAVIMEGIVIYGEL